MSLLILTPVSVLVQCWLIDFYPNHGPLSSTYIYYIYIYTYIYIYFFFFGRPSYLILSDIVGFLLLGAE